MTIDLDDQLAVRRTTGAAIALGLSEILGKAATFLLFLLAARMLGVSEFGVFSWGLSLGMLLMMIPSFGLDARVLQVGSAQPQLLDRLYGALVGIRLVAFVATMAVPTTAIVAYSGPTTTSLAVLLLVAACLLDPLNDACRSACGVLQRQRLPAAVMVAQRFAALALCVGLLALTRALWCAALGYLVAVVLGNIGMFAVARCAGARARLRGSMPQVRVILRAAPVLGLEAVSTMGLFRIDAAFIALLLGTDAVGIYNSSYRIFETILFVSWSLSRAVVPVIAARSDQMEHVQSWTRRFLVVMVALYLPYAAVLLVRGDDLVGWLYGPELVSPGLMPALAFSPLLFGVAHLCGSVLVARHPDPMIVVASLAALAVNVGLDVLLLPRVGIVGAGYATTAAFLVQGAILLVAVRRVTGPLALVGRIAVVVASAAAAAVVMVVTGPLVLALLAGGLTYAGTWLALTVLVDPLLLVELRQLRPRAPGAPEPEPELVSVTPSRRPTPAGTPGRPVRWRRPAARR